MKQLPKVGSYEFLTEPFHCDFTNHLQIGHLGNHMLNAADYHSNDRGYGMNYLRTINKAWVLSRLTIELSAEAKSYDRLNIETWVENAMKFFTSRNFAITTTDGKNIGYGRSIWAMIDTQTRQPTDIFSVNDGLIKTYIEKEKPCPIEPASRVKMGSDTQLKSSNTIRYSDIDINGHLNSIKYIEHVLDLWPKEWYDHHRVKRIDIAYVIEAYAGDTINFYVESLSELEHQVRITKLSADGETLDSEQEICRTKVIFVKD